MSPIEEIKRLLSLCTLEQRREVFETLRNEFPIHRLENKLGARAEIILEAIDRASDLTLRGVRGLIAEAAFEIYVVQRLVGWTSTRLVGDYPYDSLLADDQGSVRVQVKMQRLKSHRPMMANEGYKWLPVGMFVVETQRTRVGLDPETGESTRPYRFGEFDVLAVSMHPSSQDWRSFMYTVADWLLPARGNDRYLLKFQPVPKLPNDRWTDDFETCVKWWRSGSTST